MKNPIEKIDHIKDMLLETDDYEPEADLPNPIITEETEAPEAEYKRQKARLAQEWSNFSGVEMPKDIDVDELSDEGLIEILYDNLIRGVDSAIKRIGFEIDNDLLAEMNIEIDLQKKTELQKKFIDGILKQTRSQAEGGKFNRGKEDTWAFYPKQIEAARRSNCSGAALLVGRMLEQAGFEVEHGIAANHAVSVVRLADGHDYYVDSRRNGHNIIALEDKAKPIGAYRYHELHHPQIAYEKIIPVPRKTAEVEVIIGNYNVMREESSRPDARGKEAKRQISELDERMKDINFGWLWFKLFPKDNGLHTEVAEWQEEEKRVAAKHDFGDHLEKTIEEQMGGLTSEQKMALTDELQKNGQEIFQFFSDLNFASLDLQNKLSPDAYKVVVIIRDALESIRTQGQEAYEFALTELKGKMLV